MSNGVGGSFLIQVNVTAEICAGRSSVDISISPLMTLAAGDITSAPSFRYISLIPFQLAVTHDELWYRYAVLTGRLFCTGVAMLV